MSAESRSEPALPGSYGHAPSGFRLPPETRLGPVRLRIADLGRSLDYYQEVVGLRVLDRDGATARLGGPDGTPLAELEERPGARPSPTGGRTGLFHFAILLPDRPSLGRFARHLGSLDLPIRAADHAVSEAIYLQDPDNLGIEVYADRPRSAWRRVGRELVMTTDPLDLASVRQAAGDAAWNGVPAGTTMGHVHLHVGDLAEAARFYSEGLGLDRTVLGYPGALFLGAGGYHHHLGTNVWAGKDARPPEADEAQLLEWTIHLPEAEQEAAVESLGGQGVDIGRHSYGTEDSVSVSDPWATGLRMSPD